MTNIEKINYYFENLNPVAKKIAFDIREVKSAYDHVWLTLSSIEQDDILNETIIKPEISIRYYKSCLGSTHSSKYDPRINVDSKKIGSKCQKNNMMYAFDRQSLSTFIHLKVGLKIIHDENIGDYRDEHSFPFSYKTKSQINLSVIVNNDNLPVRDDDLCKPFLEADTNQLSAVECQVFVEVDGHGQMGEISNGLADNEYNKLTYLSDNEQFNLLSNSGSKNTLLGSSIDSTDSENDTKDQNEENCKLLPEKVQIPKGFDFLSNW